MVCLLVMFVSLAKTAEPIKMPFGADSGGSVEQGRPNLGGNDASCVMDILGGGRKNSVTFYTVL